jgi:hypothetical protein
MPASAIPSPTFETALARPQSPEVAPASAG